VFNLEGKVALVTGGTRGIGLAIAKLFKNLGAKVIITGRNKEKLKFLEEKEGFISYKCDISNKEEVEDTIKDILEKEKKIDILVNNAGITKDALFVRMKDEDFEEVVKVNLLGTFYVTKRVLPSMVKQKYGRIVNISSVVGLMGNAGQVNYSASKAGLLGLTKSLAKEFGSRGITVNAIAPGFIQTEMTHVLSEDVIKNFMDIIPLKRAGNPEDVAKAVLFLASDFAGYITGQVINVDGGMVMQ
jgi:3-oxoacyl-[acyl-carrier protein] reductase